MQMNFHFAIALPSELSQVVEKFRPVFFGWKEKRVLRRSTVGIVKLACKFWVVFQPIPRAPPCNFKRWLRPERLVVVNKAKEHMRWRNEFVPLASGKIAGQPEMEILHHKLVRKPESLKGLSKRGGEDHSRARQTVGVSDIDSHAFDVEGIC